MCHLHTNASAAVRQSRMDPTRTLMIRRRFEADFAKRFAILKALVKAKLAEPHVFGLQTNRFEFGSNPEKVQGFMTWLEVQQSRGDVDLIVRDGTLQPGRPWANVYVDSAYQQGIRRAQAEIKKAGGESLPGDSFNRPVHAERIAQAYARTYSDLKNITTEMDRQISNTLAQGLAEGRNPLTLADDINNRIDTIGLTRARTLARTEMIRAHHAANVQEYRDAGAVGVDVEAEWVTAGDDRVCDECEGLAAAGPYSLDAIESMIPAHPNCRCVAVPLLKD